ncbi:unnamed protein product [Polarella glacialis]|uniref:Uncharacterized protein n=1 Tax=Polarella glacialis TaxID=89957 RepID=A0A813DFY2_POLGL|nr:unnamed protein product [Polarella glacialis]
MGWLMQAKDAVKMHTFEQGVHGQRGRKPTGLLALRLPTLAKYIHTRQLPVEYQLEVQTDAPLRGKDSQGAWRTSAAKEYPQSMCVALAKGFHDTLRAHHAMGVPSHEEEEEDDEEFQECLQTYMAFVVQHDRYQEEQMSICGDYNPTYDRSRV